MPGGWFSKEATPEHFCSEPLSFMSHWQIASSLWRFREQKQLWSVALLICTFVRMASQNSLGGSRVGGHPSNELVADLFQQIVQNTTSSSMCTIGINLSRAFVVP
ncbi:hypothetical protein M758_9G136600 [Ceratodon purpureus]|nr:hypothetical protein M758_9G136600 [Ceratodon purpureus]